MTDPQKPPGPTTDTDIRLITTPEGESLQARLAVVANKAPNSTKTPKNPQSDLVCPPGEPNTQSEMEPATGPATEPAMEPAMEPATGPDTKPATEPPTEATSPTDTANPTPTEPEQNRRNKKRRQTTKFTSVLNTSINGRPNVPQEEDFIRAVEAGDYPTVRRMLRNYPKLDVNCTDMMGRTPLRIAVQNENEEIVDLLLDRAGTQNMYESLLLAISLDHEGITLSILRHPVYAKLEQQTKLYSNDSIFLSSTNEDSLFAAETTPLVLAAQKNRYEVLSLLLDRGAKIEEPHDVSCDCGRCKAMLTFDELRCAKSRLNAFKGLASEAYICLSSPDPILTAFNLRQKLNHVARNEKHYRDEYEELRSRLSQYVVRLLDCVRGNEELDVLLNMGQTGEYEVFGRLHLALRYNEKMFVAHSSCQKKLTTIWYGEAKKLFNQWPSWAHPLFIICVGIFFPFTSIAYLLAPACKASDYLRIPFIKFIGQSASYFMFLSLVCTFSLTETPSKMRIAIGNSNKTHQDFKNSLSDAGLAYSEYLRNYSPPKIQVVLNIFVIGMIWQECKQLYTSNLKDYFNSPFNMMDTLSLLLYLASFVLRYVSCYKTYTAHVYFAMPENLKGLKNKAPDALYRFYWLYADRYYWDAFDPVVLAEGLFAVANVVSFSRLFYLLAANEQLGPLQISLRRMVWDISRFLSIFAIVCIAFMVGLNNLYWYYEPSVRSIVELNVHQATVTQAEEAFSTIEKTFTTVFWSIFGMGESSVVKLSTDYQGAFTERVGYCMFGVYNIVIVVVLLNMLIAMMSRSFDDIAAEEDVEWKFARAQLYMDFISDGCTIPVPFNIIPSPKTIYRTLATCKKRCKAHSSASSNQGAPPQQLNNMRHLGEDGHTANTNTSWNSSGSVSSKSSEERALSNDEQSGRTKSRAKTISNLGSRIFNPKHKPPIQRKTPFETVVKRLVKRYIFERQEVDATELEGDMDELKQDLSGMRFEIHNIISTSQKKIINSVNYLSARVDRVTSIVEKVQIDLATPVNRAASQTDKAYTHNILGKQSQVRGLRGILNEVTSVRRGRHPKGKSPFHQLSRMVAKHDTVVPQTARLAPHDINQVRFKDTNVSRTPLLGNRLPHPNNPIVKKLPDMGQVNKVKGTNRSRLVAMADDAAEHKVKTRAGCREVDVGNLQVNLLQRRSNGENDCASDSYSDNTQSDSEKSDSSEDRHISGSSGYTRGKRIYFRKRSPHTQTHNHQLVTAPQVSNETDPEEEDGEPWESFEKSSNSDSSKSEGLNSNSSQIRYHDDAGEGQFYHKPHRVHWHRPHQQQAREPEPSLWVLVHAPSGHGMISEQNIKEPTGYGLTAYQPQLPHEDYNQDHCGALKFDSQVAQQHGASQCQQGYVNVAYNDDVVDSLGTQESENDISYPERRAASNSDSQGYHFRGNGPISFHARIAGNDDIDC